MIYSGPVVFPLKKKLEPTPGPWRVLARQKFILEENRMLQIPIDDGHGMSIAWMVNRPKPEIFGSDEANARHIVKCVNMHEELLTALNGALVALKYGANVDQQAAMDYGLEVFARAKEEGGAE